MDTERGPFSESDERPLEFFSTLAPGWTRGTRHPKKTGYAAIRSRPLPLEALTVHIRPLPPAPGVVADFEVRLGIAMAMARTLSECQHEGSRGTCESTLALAIQTTTPARGPAAPASASIRPPPRPRRRRCCECHIPFGPSRPRRLPPRVAELDAEEVLEGGGAARM